MSVDTKCVLLGSESINPKWSGIQTQDGALMAGNLVTFLGEQREKGLEQCLVFHKLFLTSVKRSEWSQIRGSLVCIAQEIPGGGKSWPF